MSEDVKWMSEHRAPDGELTFRVGRTKSGFVAEWPGTAKLFADPSGAARWEVDAGADQDTLAKIQQGIARALVRHLQGGFGVHAAAASLNGRAIACIGRSGLGKSTLIADFCKRYGAALHADDVACLELEDSGVKVLPGERLHWMLPASARAIGVEFDDADVDQTDKYSVDPPVAAEAPAELAVLVALAFDDDVAHPVATRIRGLDALQVLVPSLARFVVDDSGAHLREYEQLRTLADRVPLFELRRPRSLKALSESSELLYRLLRGSP